MRSFSIISQSMPASSSPPGTKALSLAITTKPWGTAIPKLAQVPAPTQDLRDSQLLYSEPKWIRMDEGGLRSLEDAGLKLEKGVYY